MDYGYGSRKDGNKKGRGYFGELKRPDGGVSTELSIGVSIDDKEVEIPLLVPTLNKSEVARLLKDKPPTEAIIKKAFDHAIMRMKQGKSPFADDDDEMMEME
jgi:hypothetical protein